MQRYHHDMAPSFCASLRDSKACPFPLQIHPWRYLPPSPRPEPMLLRLRMLAVRLHVQVALGRLHRGMPQVVTHHQERYPSIELMRRCRMPQPVGCCRLQQPSLLWIWTGLGR